VKDLINFYGRQYPKLIDQIGEHLILTGLSVLLSCLISIPLGIWIARKQRWSALVLNITGILQTIPSIALLGFLIPILGIGIQPAIFALFLYSLLPIVRNVYTGITNIDPTIIESAHGMGMSPSQVLRKVEIPLALPTIFAGIRTATVINVGVATLAAYIAAGGLGEFIFGGIALNNSTMILAGALPAALLAILLDYLLGLLQNSKAVNLKRSLSYTAVILILFISFSALSKGQQTKLKAGFAPEFIGRNDGLPALKRTYGLKISNVVLGPALMYKAIYEGDVSVISGYSTDGRIKSYNLRVLEDDKKSFPPYQAALLVRNDIVKSYPELKDVINKLAGSITDSTMTFLNYRVDHNKEDVDVVARDFLKQLDLWEEPGNSNKTLVIGSKIFTEQYILTDIYKFLIEGYTDFEVETKKGMGGTKICLDALKAGEIDMYPEYSGTALQVILNQPNQADKSPKEVFELVKNKLDEDLQLYYSSPLGFNNTYALMMREAEASQLNITTISELQDYLQL